MNPPLPTLRLKPGKEKSIGLRHPWVYSGALLQPPRDSGPALLADSRGGILATGFAEKDASIAFRAAAWGDKPADFFSKSFWLAKIERALSFRRTFINSAQTDCFRMVHGEADGIPGLTADIYGEYLVLQSGWSGAECCMPVWIDVVQALGFKHILRKRAGVNKPGQWNEPEGVLCGHIPAEVKVWENGICYMVDLIHGQKTGFFLDQRENRQLVRMMADGRKVVNTFCYTGGFSLAAAFGGAAEVVSVDLSQNALDQLRHNWRVNAVQTPHEMIRADVFSWLRTLPKDKFDLIVLDPPAFAASKAALPRAARGYKDILLQALKAVRSGGMVMIFSCSQHIGPDLLQKIAFGAALDAGRQVLVLKKLSAGMDHPFSLYHPEGEYLKGMLLKAW